MSFNEQGNGWILYYILFMKTYGMAFGTYQLIFKELVKIIK